MFAVPHLTSIPDLTRHGIDLFPEEGACALYIIVCSM
jgi:hypothetical protein